MKRIAWLGLSAALAFAAHAQAPDTLPDRSGVAGGEFWAGYSPSSPKWGVLGNRPGLSFAIVAGRITRRVKTARTYALDYTIDIVPFAIASPPLTLQDEPRHSMVVVDGGAPRPECGVSDFHCRFPSGSAFGAGVSPLGITAVYRRDKMLQPRLGATGGFLLFNKRVPTVESTAFNFTATLEAGIQLLDKAGDGVVLMYRFHHLSNAGTGFDNSALASHLLSVGARIRTRSR